MKTLLLTIVLLVVSTVSNAQDFYLQLKPGFDNVYKSLSGVVLISDDTCNVPDYSDVILHYYNNPADSNFGPLRDNFTYVISEPFYNEDISSIEYQDITIQCPVFGVARLNETGDEIVQYNSIAVYDADNQTAYFGNVRLVENLIPTGESFEFVKIKFNIDGTYEVLELTE